MAEQSLTLNKDIDYIQKDFISAVDAMISFATVNFGPGTSANRLWTDFNADSFSRNWLEIVAFMADVCFFYFDNQATQAYLQTASVRSAVNNIAKQFGFTPATAQSASGTAIFTVSGAGTIPRGFRVSATNGSTFFVTNDIVAAAAGDVQGTVLEGTIVSEQFIAEGIQNEEFQLTGPNVIVDQDNSNPLDVTPQVSVAGNDYRLVSSFLRFNGTDTAPEEDSLGELVGGGGRVFTIDERSDGTPFIRFGDGVFGRKLSVGETITVSYRTGGGTAGNIPQGTLTTLVDNSAIATAVNNATDFSGGSDAQTIEQLRDLIPASLRTLERAVAEQDYSDLLKVKFTEVFDASTEVNNTDPGIDLNIYVIPQGSGIPKITDNLLLRNRLADYIDRRKTVTIQFTILDAFGVDMLISLEVFISNTASKTTVRQSITTALENFFSLTTGGRDGSGIGFAEEIYLNDIANIVETIEGVVRFEIKKLSYRPRIQERIIGLTTEYLYSDVNIFPPVEEVEWLLAASGTATETGGTVIYDNVELVPFSYNSGDGKITYTFPEKVDLSGVAPGDDFVDGAGTKFAILAVDVENSELYLSTGLTVDNTVVASDDGSVENGTTNFESFKCFKKKLNTTSNLSVDSITDINLDLSVQEGTVVSTGFTTLLDNDNIFVPNEYATGEFYLVDAASNIWEIIANDSNTFTTGANAVNDAAITAATAGDYSIVIKLTGEQVVFQGNVFNIQYNTKNTIFSIGAQFIQLGTIGDEFQISEEQANLGTLGVAVDILSENAGEVRLNAAPQLLGVSSDWFLLDSAGNSFNITAVDNRSLPAVIYEETNKDSELELQEAATQGQDIAQGFQVSASDDYAVVSFFLKREGNITGNLTAKIVDDDGGGLPDLTSIVANGTSNPVPVTNVDKDGFEKIIFTFTTPPSLTSGTQYHLVLSSDASYKAAQISGVTIFDNTGLESFTYNPTTGVIQYGGVVDLSSVLPGHFFQDDTGALFEILAVDDGGNEVTLADGLSVNLTVDDSGDGAIIQNDRILVGTDGSSPTYADGELSQYDGTSWSNSTLGPAPFAERDAIFTVEGTKNITIESNLTPELGEATLSRRYYDDENQISLILGISEGSITSASDVNAVGVGTVSGVSNRSVDTFTFRTSRFADDVVNLRKNEVPQITADDISLTIFGGVD